MSGFKKNKLTIILCSILFGLMIFMFFIFLAAIDVVVPVVYEGGSGPYNNTQWIGEKSLALPLDAVGLDCYILGSKMDGSNGGTVRGGLGIINNSNDTYEYASNYEVEVNSLEGKIEITKWNGYTSTNLSNTERSNLYLRIHLLCY